MNEEWIRQSLRPAAAPAGLWDRIDRLRARQRRTRLAATVAATLLVAAGVVALRPRPVDLGAYLAPVRASQSAAAARVALERPAPGFVDATLDARRFGEWRCERAYSCGLLRQTVWSRDDGETVALFEAPPEVRFLYGDRTARLANVGTEFLGRGLRCDRVDCAQQSTYSFTARGQRYVLVSKNVSGEEAAWWISRLQSN